MAGGQGFSDAERDAVVIRLKLKPGESGKNWREIFHRLRALEAAGKRRPKVSALDLVRRLPDFDRDAP